ncbi:MAG: hypothetical protein ABI977_33235 [Acidobacteriota bacterium]
MPTLSKSAAEENVTGECGKKLCQGTIKIIFVAGEAIGLSSGATRRIIPNAGAAVTVKSVQIALNFAAKANFVLHHSR